MMDPPPPPPVCCSAECSLRLIVTSPTLLAKKKKVLFAVRMTLFLIPARPADRVCHVQFLPPRGLEAELAKGKNTARTPRHYYWLLIPCDWDVDCKFCLESRLCLSFVSGIPKSTVALLNKLCDKDCCLFYFIFGGEGVVVFHNCFLASSCHTHTRFLGGKITSWSTNHMMKINVSCFTHFSS